MTTKSRVPCDPAQGCRIQWAGLQGTVPAEGPAGAGDHQHGAHKPCPSQPAAAQVGPFLLICTEASLESFILAQGRRHSEETSGKLCRWVELRVDLGSSAEATFS